MNKNVKTSFLMAAAIVFSMSTISSPVRAAESDSKLSTNKEYVYDVTYANGNSLLNSTDYDEVITVKDSTFDGIVDENGNIIVPSKEKMKERYLEKFNKDPQLYKDSINNIDNLVDQTINVIENAKAKKETSSKADFSSSELADIGILSTSYWRIEPYVSKTTNGITYSQTWVGYDNYRSSVKTKCTYEKSVTTKKEIGFTGDADIKAKFGFSATKSVEQKASITTETSIPAWTIWETRPYITWTQYDYLGAWTVETYNPITGNTTYSTSSKTGTNIVMRTSNNEAWTATNTSHNSSATSPLPPTGVPNVDWK